MLSLGLRGQARRVGCEKGKGRFRILAILGQVEMHPAYQIADRVATLKEVLQGTVGFGKLCIEGLAHIAPQRGKNLGGEVFRADHDWRRACQPGQFRGIVRGRPNRRAVLVTALGSAEGGGEPGAKIPPPGKSRRENCSCVVDAKREQAVSASPCEGALEAFRPVCIQNAAVIGFHQRQGAVRRQNRGEVDHGSRFIRRRAAAEDNRCEPDRFCTALRHNRVQSP
ncbi:MAG: hypothetical protein WAN43_10810 [Rhodomicrobium sp.]